MCLVFGNLKLYLIAMARIPLILSALLLFSCKSRKPLSTVQNLDLQQYEGTWYEIAKLPNSFEKDLTCVSATYTIKENGKIEVFNTGKKTNGEQVWKTIKGTATVPDKSQPGRLKVTFFWPFAGDYYVIDVAQVYSYALVGSPNRRYLWILARTRALDETIYAQLVKLANEKGFPIDKIEAMDQSCEIQKEE